jgi:hypothetical protein
VKLWSFCADAKWHCCFLINNTSVLNFVPETLIFLPGHDCYNSMYTGTVVICIAFFVTARAMAKHKSPLVLLSLSRQIQYCVSTLKLIRIQDLGSRFEIRTS